MTPDDIRAIIEAALAPPAIDPLDPLAGELASIPDPHEHLRDFLFQHLPSADLAS